MAALAEVFVAIKPQTDRLVPDLQKKLKQVDARSAGDRAGKGSSAAPLPPQLGDPADEQPDEGDHDADGVGSHGDVDRPDGGGGDAEGDGERDLDEDAQPRRTLVSVNVVDVAPVINPAYPSTTAGLRSLAVAKDVPVTEVEALAVRGSWRSSSAAATRRR